ncbi:Dolichyl-diphosphooligosaccharide--protein glycosyltransferase subunit DAD1 [Aphelenchoides bicaudatus]|nr:Dolichyl-diphosphooligosaccharide--protein glycosyltransferase subunit DAD1 [Aphelenchoides bicaudatus]
MDDHSKIMGLLEEMKTKKNTLAIYETAQSKTNAELLELEQQLRDETDAKLKEDHQLATLRNEEAMLRMELEEIIANEDATNEQDFNASLQDFSVAGTADDLANLETRLIELKHKAETLEDDVKTLKNDNQLSKSDLEEVNNSILEITKKREAFANQTLALESQITQLLEDKKKLVAEQEILTQQILEVELKNRPKGAERGTSDFMQYDNYVKQIRAKLVEAREQKRQAELQHLDISQRLEAKRRRREMAEKRRVTDATVCLMNEVYKQSSFVETLKICISAFYNEHEKWAQNTKEKHKSGEVQLPDTQDKLLDRIQKYRKMMEMVRDSICKIIDRIPPAYKAEYYQYQAYRKSAQKRKVIYPTYAAFGASGFFLAIYFCDWKWVGKNIPVWNKRYAEQ